MLDRMGKVIKVTLRFGAWGKDFLVAIPVGILGEKKGANNFQKVATDCYYWRVKGKQ